MSPSQSPPAPVADDSLTTGQAWVLSVTIASLAAVCVALLIAVSGHVHSASQQPVIAQSQQPGVVEQPGEQPGVVEQPGVEQPGVVEQPRPVEQPGVVEQPRPVEQPGVVEQPRPVEQPGAGQPAEAADPTTLQVVKVAALGRDDPLAPIWDNAPLLPVSMLPQQITMPRVQSAAVERLGVRAASDGERIAFHISWEDARPDWNVDSGRFSDAVAIGFPLDAGAPPMMGAKGLRMEIIYWKALWQRDLDQHYQDVQDLHPNFWSDLYWFAEGEFPYPVPGSFQRPEARQYFPAHAAGNPMADFARTQPVQELVAEGWGSLTPQKTSASAGKGIYRDGRWEVVFSRPLETEDPLDHQFTPGQPGQIVFAVWDGGAGNVGGRKQWSNWVPYRIHDEVRRTPRALEVARVARLGEDEPYAAYWADVASVGVPVQPQQMAMPALADRSINSVRVQGATDGQRVALRLTWSDTTPEWHTDSGRFCDAVSIGFPLDAHAPPMMGAKGLRMQIIYWKALWQYDVDHGYQDVQDLHPNFWSDLYWFAEGKFPYPIASSFKRPEARQYFAAHAAGNPMATFERTQPVQELLAEGWGSLTKQRQAVSSGRGAYRDGRWTVVISRPLTSDDPLDVPFRLGQPNQLAVAVWNGAGANRGARKHWSMWTEIQMPH